MPSTGTSRIENVDPAVAIKAPCRVTTTANITLSGEQTIDGVAVVSGDRVLVKDQTTASENGIYIASATAWARATDFDGARDVVEGTLIKVTDGTTYAGAYFQVTTSNPIVPGTTSIGFSVDAQYTISAGIRRYDSMAALIAAQPTEDSVYITSYYGGWAASVAGPKGGHYRHKTGATNTSPTVGSAVSVSTIGTGTQAGYCWDANGDEWFISREEKSYSVTQFGAIGDNSNDDWQAITDAEYIANAQRKKVFFPAPSVGYRVNQPLIMTTFSDWEGETEQIYIFKHGNTTSGLPTRLIPGGGGASDTMDVDAVAVVDHADNAYASYVKIKNLYFRNETTNSTTVDYNIFSPRINYFHFENVSTRGAAIAGWRWYDAWQGEIESMFVADAARGFNAEPDGLASGSGTSLTFIRPYAFNCDVGYDIYGLAYSTIVSPACDEPTNIGYYFETCNNLTITSLGIETVTTATYSVRIVQSYLTITGAKENNNNPTTAKLSLATGSRVNISNMRFLDYAVAGSAANLELSGGSHLITENCVLPTNGTSFISYGSGSTWTDNLDGVLRIQNSTSKIALNPNFLQKPLTTGITAYAGGGQANAVELTKEVHEVSTVATSGDSVRLPVPVAGESRSVVVINNGANAMDVFPNSGAAIQGTGTNVAQSVASGASARYTSWSATRWVPV